MRKHTRRGFLELLGKGAALSGMGKLSQRFSHAASDSSMVSDSGTMPQTYDEIIHGWMNPKRTYRPHTRWWWPGNAVTQDGIRWELDQMCRQGVGGVELMTPWRMYTEGNIDYLSREHLDMVAFTIREAKQRDMEVAFSFCPGWKFGGYWVPPTQRSKVLAQGWKDVEGPALFDSELPAYTVEQRVQSGLDPSFTSDAPDENQIIAVVAARVVGEHLDSATLVELTPLATNNHLRWQVPNGTWRLMAFRLKYTGEICATTDNFPQRQWVVDHFSGEAVRNYCEYLGDKLYQSVGQDFGKVLDTLFSDSFEVMVFDGTVHWTNSALAEFKRYKGYDLNRYLPAIWWDIGDLAPKVRYDINDFLGWLGIQAFFKPFIDWGQAHNIDARIQPYYRFTEELIQGAGLAPRPEMEVTRTGFTVIADPRKAVAAGGHLYGREIISAEAYTFLHPQRYRTTLEEMKVASDGFLRDGVTQFYNHGYIYSPEMHVAPSRDVPWANRISHWNIWWKHYHHLTAYLSRCCYLLRQGHFVGDVLVYSPQATVWTQKVLFNNERRIMPYGNVGQTLVANGYDFDPVNDDILQHYVEIQDRNFQIRGMQYRFLVLPSTKAVPVATMETIRKFVHAGGVVIALGEIPSESVGLLHHTENDVRVKQIAAELFGTDGNGTIHPGGGRTYVISSYPIPDFNTTERTFVPTDVAAVPEYTVKDVSDLNGQISGAATVQLSSSERAMIDALRAHLRPDFALVDNAASGGLTFIHRRIGTEDLYFVSNLSAQPADTTISFRVPGKIPEIWDAMTGDISPVHVYTSKADCVAVSTEFMPYESRFYLFRDGVPQAHLTESSLDRVLTLNADELTGVVERNGEVKAVALEGTRRKVASCLVKDLPTPQTIDGLWKLNLAGYKFEKITQTIPRLQSWTENPNTKNFSGTGQYSISFALTDGFLDAGTEALLDLGVVGNVAEVELNGRSAGVAWMRPYRLNVTGFLKKGLNRLDVRVTNTLINYVAGLETLPPVPEAIVRHYGHSASSYLEGSSEWRHREKNFYPLPPSGLLGPVMLIPRRKITMKLV